MKKNKLRYMLALSMMLLMGLFVISCGSKDVNPPPPDISQSGGEETPVVPEDEGPEFRADISVYIEAVELDSLSDSQPEVTAKFLTGYLESTSASIDTEGVVSVQGSGYVPLSESYVPGSEEPTGDVVITGFVTMTDTDPDTETPECPFTLIITDGIGDAPDIVSLTVLDPEDLTGEPLVEIISQDVTEGNFTIAIEYMSEL